MSFKFLEINCICSLIEVKSDVFTRFKNFLYPYLPKRFEFIYKSIAAILNSSKFLPIFLKYWYGVNCFFSWFSSLKTKTLFVLESSKLIDNEIIWSTSQ
nr:hypothetical protein [Spiroplasma taiwanense]